MMKRKATIALAAFSILIASAAGMLYGFVARAAARPRPDVREQLIGSWTLVSRVSTLANGSVLPDPGLAATPKGVLIYDRSGHVAAQLSRHGRTLEMIPDECREAVKVRGTNDTSQTILGYDAYFGTYSVDEKEGVVTHHLEIALFPGDIGKSIKRNISISGDKLTLKFNTTTHDGFAVTRTLEWERLK
jgi:lipocalin-like protein